MTGTRPRARAAFDVQVRSPAWRGRLAHDFQCGAAGGDSFVRAQRNVRRLRALNAAPRDAPSALRRRRASRSNTRRAVPGLEGEIGAQEIRKVGAVGADDEPQFVFAQAHMVEQDVARFIAQHHVQRRPRRRGVERSIEQRLDPRGIQVFGRAAPCVAQGPEGSLRGARARRLAVAHGDLARDGAVSSAGAPSRTSFACQVRRRWPAPRPRRARNKAARRAGRAIWPRRCHRARSGTARPRSASSAAKMMRSGAPVQGATGEGRIATSAASSHRSWACATTTEKRTTKHALAIGSNAVAVAANRRVGFK